jgi:hypothetical protein
VPAVEEASGDVIIPQRRLGYAKLCIAVGSTSHYFDTPGAADNTISLNGPGDAERFPEGRSWFVRGGIARLMYVGLHLLPHRAVLGWRRTCGLLVARALIRRNSALVTLH